MLRKVVCGLCRRRRGLSLVAGAVGVLVGVEHLLTARAAQPVAVQPVPAPPVTPPPVGLKRRFKIAQTKSELGYVYWVLRELGENPSYALFDTWQEAMAEATRRLSAGAEAISAPQADAVLVSA